MAGCSYPPPCSYFRNDDDSLREFHKTLSLSYIDQWRSLKRDRPRHLVVFDCCWWSDASNPNIVELSRLPLNNVPLLLVACTNTGEIIIWNQSESNTGGEGDDIDDAVLRMNDITTIENKRDRMDGWVPASLDSSKYRSLSPDPLAR